MESCGDLSWEDLLDMPEDLSGRESEAWVVAPVMPDVTDVPVSASSVVTEFCDGFSCCLDWGFVEPQSFSSSHSCTVTQEEVRFEGPQVKAPPQSRRRMMPPPHHCKIRTRHLKRSRGTSRWKTRCVVRERERDEAVPGRK